MSGDALTRRRFLRSLGGGAAVVFGAACGTGAGVPGGSTPSAVDAPDPSGSTIDDADDPVRLLSRPDPDVAPSGAEGGLQPLGVTSERDATLFIPAVATRGRAVPLMVTLHGAGGGRHGGLGRFRDAGAEGVAILLPLSRGPSWDIIVEGAFGSDIEVIDAALAETFARISVDPSAVALAGFSDGASYALSVGLANGDLFPFVIGASPGFLVETAFRGRPDVFVSHGRQDRTLPIDRTSREIVPELEAAGYDVTYVEFGGEHELPPEIARREIAWFLERSGSTAR